MAPIALPRWVKNILQEADSLESLTPGQRQTLRAKFARFSPEKPDVSIVIPVYNEEQSLVRTLCSLAEMSTERLVEILIVNNNSTDRTQEILDTLGVRSVMEKRPGVGAARQTGLLQAKGKYLLTGDGDTLYPPTWVDSMMKELVWPDAAAAWGRHSFLPSKGNGRVSLAAYEFLKQTLYRFRNVRRPHLNAMGANMGFKREWALEVGGYRPEIRHGEDGRLALALLSRGRVAPALAPGARVWTSSRRLDEEGSLLRSLGKRLKKELPRLGEYITGRNAVLAVKAGSIVS